MCTHLVRRLRPHLQRLVGRFLGVCLAGNVAACASEGRGAGWAGTVDTLPGGAVAVRSPSEGLWTPDTRWRLVEELRIGSIEAEGPELFGSVAGLAVDSAGRIYVLDRQAKEVRAFDAAGAFLRRIGREGGGPGELGDPIALAIGPEGSLLVVDVGNGRYARFDTSGAYLGSTRREVGGYVVPARVGFDPRGRFHEGARVRFGEDFGAAILRFESGLTDPHAFRIPEWETDEYVLTRGEMRMTAEVPFAPRLVWALDPGEDTGPPSPIACGSCGTRWTETRSGSSSAPSTRSVPRRPTGIGPSRGCAGSPGREGGSTPPACPRRGRSSSASRSRPTDTCGCS